MPGSLLNSEAILAYVIVNEGVVTSNLRKVSRSDQIGSAVADIQHKELRAGRGFRGAITSVVPIP